ncbi:hypothetical protein BB559_006716 [Furculomyces boomerangus]|uniref:MULE transposase domain-containing protein n=2 Tax=Harpellales TaxID=61421 RepID=A0A2T9Y146_9FUNG|nr:hypothetical protein BB559_006716 [Furculomyces boomerangus]PWA01669.1 hypothetical protein BB558_002212 [Smittium angustum]
MPDTEDNDYFSKWRILTKRQLKSYEYKNRVNRVYEANNHSPRCESISMEYNKKSTVIKLFLGGMNHPWEIKQNLFCKGVNILNNQIYSILGNFKRSNKAAGLTTNILKDYINKNTFFENIGYSQAYISSYSIIPDFDYLKTSFELYKYSDALNIDTTYCLIDLGFPVIVVGVSDAKTTEKRNSKKNNGFLKHKHIIADSAASITKAVNKFDPECIKTHFWAHVYRNIEKKLKSVNEKSKIQALLDIKLLQLSNNKGEFDLVLNLFLSKISNQSDFDEFA